MNSTRILAVAFVSASLLLTGAAFPQSTRPAGFDALAAQLGSDDAKARDEAQAGIVKLGDAAVKAVEELAATTDNAEVKLRTEAIIRQIAAASITRPTLVTMRFHKAPAREVYESLFKQAKAKIELWPPTLFERARAGEIPPVTIDLKGVTFWDALIALEEQTGLFVDDMGREMRLTERNGAGPALAGKRNVSINGPFMVVADDQFAGPMIHQLQVFVEPRIRVLAHARQARIIEALDVNGEPVDRGPFVPQLAAMRARAGREMDEFGGNSFDVHLDAPIPRAGRLRGSVRLSVAVNEQSIEILDVAKANNVERKVDGRRFLLNMMNPDPGEWFLTLIAYNVGPNAVGASKTKIELVDAKDNPLSSGGHGMHGGNDRVVFNMAFQQGPNVGPPAKLKLTFPAETREIDIPFEFGTKPKDAEAAEAAEAE